MEVLAFILIPLAIAGLFLAASDRHKIDDLRASLQATYPDAKIHIYPLDTSFLVVDLAKKVIALGTLRAKGARAPYRVDVPAKDIVKIEVLRDGVEVAATNRSSQAIGAVVGGLAFGGIGALAGALTGSTSAVKRTTRLSIQITLDDADRPVHEVTFYQAASKKGGMKGQAEFDLGAQNIAEFAAYIENAMRQPSQEEHSEAKLAGKPKVVMSFAEQVAELWKLKEVGALTQEEFEIQKAKLSQD